MERRSKNPHLDPPPEYQGRRKMQMPEKMGTPQYRTGFCPARRRDPSFF
jgi:hypothetical protein